MNNEIVVLCAKERPANARPEIMTVARTIVRCFDLLKCCRLSEGANEESRTVLDWNECVKGNETMSFRWK